MIRTAHEGDIEAIRLIASITWKIAYASILPNEIIDRFLQDVYAPEILERRLKSTHYIIVEEEGYNVGFANYEIRDNNVHILALFVLPDYQYKGFGTKLLEYIEKHVPETITHGFVDVISGNKSATSFYRKYGFEDFVCTPESRYGYPLKMVRMVYTVK